MILTLSGGIAGAVVRCTMPDGTTEIEGLAAAARCRSEFAASPSEAAAPASSIGVPCSDQLLATGGEATAAERVEGRISPPMVVAAPDVFGHRAAPVALARADQRGSSERTIQLLRTVVLQT